MRHATAFEFQRNVGKLVPVLIIFGLLVTRSAGSTTLRPTWSSNDLVDAGFDRGDCAVDKRVGALPVTGVHLSNARAEAPTSRR
jgi:hypothetical protein